MMHVFIRSLYDLSALVEAVSTSITLGLMASYERCTQPQLVLIDRYNELMRMHHFYNEDHISHIHFKKIANIIYFNTRDSNKCHISYIFIHFSCDDWNWKLSMGQ